VDVSGQPLTAMVAWGILLDHACPLGQLVRVHTEEGMVQDEELRALVRQGSGRRACPARLHASVACSIH
jgi:hypothetical protein